MDVRVQSEDFDAGAEIAAMRLRHKNAGALVAFVGQVREIRHPKTEHAHEADAKQQDITLHAMTLEHYPGMTEKSLQHIIALAEQRWPLQDALIVHRYGRLLPQEQIVLVLVCSAHRQSAFEACAFIMDYLKTEAPFWKKEHTSAGDFWVEARFSDEVAKAQW